MIKTKIGLFLLIIMTVVVTGCGAEEMPTSGETLQYVEVSESNGLGGLNESSKWEFNEERDLQVIQNVIDHAEAEDTTLEAPDYDVYVDYGDEDTRGMHFEELENGKYAIVYIGHENEVYVAKEEDSKQLHHLLH